MSLYPEIFRSVEWIWGLWVISFVVCLGLGYSLRRGAPVTLQALHKEDGAAYAVPYVMTFPLYAMFVGLVIECSLMLIAKVGTMYSAYAATRSAVVWESAKTGSGSSSQQKMQDKAQRAAFLAMVPFASGSSQHSAQNVSGAELVPAVIAAAQQYRGGRFVNSNYLTRKVRYAASHMKVTSITRESNEPDALLTATVNFDAPFHIPGIGRLLGKPSGRGYYVMDVVTQVSLPSESPQNAARDIGIRYLSE